MRLVPALRAIPILAAAILVASCGSDNTTTNTGGSIALTLTPTSATVPAGGSVQVTGTVSRTNFTGDIGIAVSSPPTGITGAVGSVVTNPGGGNSATVTINVASSVNAGTYTISVVASGSGVTSVSQDFTLTVTGGGGLPDVLFHVSPHSNTIAAGSSANYSIKAERPNGFSGTIVFAASTAPAGLTVTFTPTSVPDSTIMNVAAATTLASGSYTIPWTATWSSGGTNSTVVALVSNGTFTVAAKPSAVTIAQGGTATSSIVTTRAGVFTGAASLATSGTLPTGLSVTFGTTTNIDSQTVSIAATSALAAGTYPVTIAATLGVSTTTTTITVTVTPAGTVRFSLGNCGATTKPIYVGVQDGSGTWVHVTGAADVYDVPVFASGKGALVFVSQNGTTFSTRVVYVSSAEMAAVVPCTPAPITGSSYSSTATGITGTDVANISFGGHEAHANQGTPAFTITGVTAGQGDVLGYRTGFTAPSVNDKMIIHRDFLAVEGGTLLPFDFNSAEAFSPATATLTVTGGANNYFLVMRYLTRANCFVDTLNFPVTGVATPYPMFGVPAAQQRATDFHNILVQQLPIGDQRTVWQSFHTMAAQTIALGAGIGAVTQTTLSGTWRRLQASFNLAADYNSAGWKYDGLNIPRTATVFFSITQSSGYLGTVSTVTLTPPDLSVAPAFLGDWLPWTGSSGSTTATASSTVPPSMCSEGAVLKTAAVGTGGA